MAQNARRWFLFCMILAISFAFVPAPAQADSLSIAFTSAQTQTAIAGSSCCTADIFLGTITNNTGSPITFQLLAGDGSSFYVAGISTSIPFPGTTLAGGGTQAFDLTVTINPFDPALAYPGTVNVVLDAISESAGQPTLTENDATVLVVRTVPEPSVAQLLAWIFLASGVWVLTRRTISAG